MNLTSVFMFCSICFSPKKKTVQLIFQGELEKYVTLCLVSNPEDKVTLVLLAKKLDSIYYQKRTVSTISDKDGYKCHTTKLNLYYSSVKSLPTDITVLQK